MTPQLPEKLNAPQLSFIRGSMVFNMQPLQKTTAKTPLDRRLDDHALTAHTYQGVGATLHNLNLATYVATSHMKATSTIRPQGSIVRSSHIHT